MSIEIRTEDVQYILEAQRNAALNEIVQQGAIIRSLQRTVSDLYRRIHELEAQQGQDLTESASPDSGGLSPDLEALLSSSNDTRT